METHETAMQEWLCVSARLLEVSSVILRFTAAQLNTMWQKTPTVSYPNRQVSDEVQKYWRRVVQNISDI
jgi:hypothetical protein